MLEIMPKKPIDKNPSYVRVNATLAKGLANRHLREVSEVIKEGVNRAEKIKAPRKGLGPAYNYKVKVLQEIYKKVQISAYTSGRKKDVERAFHIFYWYSDEKKLSIKLEGRQRDKHHIYNRGPTSLCIITRHFCARVYERLNTNKLERVEKELAACAYIIFQLHIDNIEFHFIKDGRVRVPTENGLYIINQKDKNSPPTVRTFIDKTKLKKDPEQKDYYEKCLNEKCLLIKYQKKNSNKTEIKKIPLQIFSDT
jgi:hypothetical protein